MDVRNTDRMTTPQSENGIDMVDKYAFNFTREAYNHHVPQQLTSGITVHVGSLAPLTTSLKQHREDVNNVSVPPLLPRKQEYHKGPKTIECVWVGMLPSPTALLHYYSRVGQPTEDTSGEGSSKKSATKRVKKTTTVSDMRKDEMNIFDFDRNALRVVAKKSDRVTKDTHLYALLQPAYADSLQGFKVGFDDVFYFRVFRDDDTKSDLPRKQATIAKIRASVFQNPTFATSQSPTPTTGESSNKAHKNTIASSPNSNLSVMATPTPPPGMLAIQHPSAASQRLKDDAWSSSKATPGKKKALKVKSKKRKAPHPIVDVLMKQRDDARKKARNEGYYVPPSDSDLRESVEEDDQDALPSPAEGSDESPVEDFVDTVLAGIDKRMHVSFEEDGDEAYPEHAVGAEDPEFLSHTEDLIEELARAEDTTTKEPKTVYFRGHNGQVINKNGKVVNSISLDRESYDGDDEAQSSRTSQTESAVLAEKVKELANKLATKQDVAGLQQALTMFRCIQNRRGPPKTSPLGVYFNVPSCKDIPIEDCAEQLKQLRVRTPRLFTMSLLYPLRLLNKRIQTGSIPRS